MAAIYELEVQAEGEFDVQEFKSAITKFGFVIRTVPVEAIAGISPMRRAPRLGDLVAGEVLRVGKNVRLEVRSGVPMDLFPGDVVVGAFGNRYATDQFEGYVPDHIVEKHDLMSVGGVCGKVRSRHNMVGAPTLLRTLGMVCGYGGEPLNLRDFGLVSSLTPGVDGYPGKRPSAQTIVVVGSSMNSGKTNTAGTISRSLVHRGFRVAAAKVTGTAAGKDCRFFEACGASPVLDFIDAGYPSTYMLGAGELEEIYKALLARLHSENPDYVVLEIADGIFQRETRMMLDSGFVSETADHVFFSAGDSLSVDSGVRFLRERGLPLRATAGILTRGPLASAEAEEITGLPCMSVPRLMSDELARLLDLGTGVEDGAETNGHISGERVAFG